MKKHWKIGLALGLSSLFTLQSPFCFLFSVSEFSGFSYGAERQATVLANSLNVRSAPGTGNTVIGKLSHGASVAVLSETSTGDGSLWYQIRFSAAEGIEATGYVMGSYLQVFPPSSSSSSVYPVDMDFEVYLESQGFPESYRQGLRELHTLYPHWIFTAQHTGLDWNEVIQNESLVGRNLVSSSSISSWKSTAPGAYDWSTSTWPGFDGSSWVAASEEIIRYYMDPRNFLNETYIFQFLLQSYDPALHTREGLASLVSGTFLEGSGTVSSSYGSSSGINNNQGGNTGNTQNSESSAANTETEVNNNNQNSTTPIGPGDSSLGTGSSNTGTGSHQSGSTINQGPGFHTENNSSENTSSLINGTGDFSDVWLGAYPGINVSKNKQGLSVSRHWADNVSATIIRVGPDGKTSSSEQTQPAESSRSEESSSSFENSSIGIPPGGETSSETFTESSSETSSETLPETSTDFSNGVSGSTYTGGDTAPYTDILMQAGIQSGVSPYVLAAMILQEQGRAGNTASVSGAGGYYNFYNFEAYASNGMSATQRGLWYASQSGSYMRPWNTTDRAIIGGAIQYGQNYMQAGQNTFYLKKFNVQGNNPYKHQYMTNIEGAAAEGAKMGAAYTKEMRQTAMHFIIPVYQNMPAEACLKPSLDGNPDNRLSSIHVEGYSLNPAFNPNTLTYEITCDYPVSSVVVQAAAVNSAAQISGTGVIALSSGITEAAIYVTAQNGTIRTYTLRFIQNNANQQGTTLNPPGTGESLPASQGQGTENNSLTGPGGSNVTIVY